MEQDSTHYVTITISHTNFSDCEVQGKLVSQLFFSKFCTAFCDLKSDSGTARQRRTKYVSPKASARPWDPLWALATP